jgi:hypothetical protein
MKKTVLITLSALLAGAAAGSSAPKSKPRAKSAEPAIVKDLRAFAAAEAAYAAVNGGFYDEPPCLIKPSSCLKSYPASKPAFLDAKTASLEIRGGYVRSFHAGGLIPADVIARGNLSPSSTNIFAFVAAPVKAGQPAYCIDPRRLCVSPTGKMGRPYDGCPADCETMK